ncbi:lectin like domain-containing protein [Eubacteriaceae bacterium ES2]|nr:lectin like domain-containing protein [Eubacteriaceae bacterium ES2]
MLKKLNLWFIVIGLLLLPTTAQAAEELQSGPLSPDFVAYQEAMENDMTTASAEYSGVIPSPIAPTQSTTTASQTLPESYDLRDYGFTAPVRDQSTWGACWTFATMGSLESYLKQEMATEVDLSENNLVWNNGFDYTQPATGGNFLMAAAYLSRYNGPVSEKDDPYMSASQTGLSPLYHVQSMQDIYGDSVAVKEAIINGGAVATFIYSETGNSDYYNAETNAYYYYGSQGIGHAVQIVGWDDNYDKNNFATTPEGNGAWIIQNSYGEDFGDGGFFYISYYDSNAGNEVGVFHNAESTDNYDRSYQYDYLGCISTRGYGDQSAWGANIFTTSGEEELDAVSTYAVAPNTTVEINIYTDLTDAGDPTSGRLQTTQTAAFDLAGYYTVRLNQPVELAAFESFSVVIKYINPWLTTPIPVEEPLLYYSSQASANPGQSYVSANGIAGWEDISAAETNVCIKAFTSQREPSSESEETAPIYYRTHIQNLGWEDIKENGQTSGSTGDGLRLEGIQIQLDPQSYNLGISYRTHVENLGWQDWCSDGAMSGTSGQGLRLEAVELALTGSDADLFDLTYRVHCQNIGWMDWVESGETAGTTGEGLRLEAIEITLTRKTTSQTTVTGLAAQAGDQAIDLFWLPVDGASRYQIAISSDGQNYEMRNDSWPDTTGHVIDLSPGTRYWFKVRAVTESGTGDWSDPATAVANIDDQGSAFMGDMLLITNESTDITTPESTGTLPAVSASAQTETASEDTEPRGIDRLVRFDTGYDLSSLDLSTLETSETYVLGDTHSFYVTSETEDDPAPITGRCAYDGQSVQVWVDNAEDAVVKLTDDQATEIGAEFDSIIYPLVTENFYAVSDLDGNGKVAILCFDIDNDASLAELPDVYTAGYFDPIDLLPEGYSDQPSNQMEIFYIDTYPAMMESYDNLDVDHPDISRAYPVLAHELQHMASYNCDVLVEGNPDWNDIWMDEALSMAAEDLYFETKGTDNQTRTDIIRWYNNDNAAEIAAGKSLLDWDNTMANYDLSYLFSQYLRTRIDQAQGDGQGILSYHDILTDSCNDYQAVEHVIQKQIDENLTFGQFMTQFRAAILLKADSGPYGFNGEDGFDELETQLYPDTQAQLKGGGAIATQLSATFTPYPNAAGKDIRFTGIFEQ